MAAKGKVNAMGRSAKLISVHHPKDAAKCQVKFTPQICFWVEILCAALPWVSVSAWLSGFKPLSAVKLSHAPALRHGLAPEVLRVGAALALAWGCRPAGESLGAD
jgi:hypothetical protein